MPAAKTLVSNYLPKMFEREMNEIKQTILNAKINLICDESQDICGQTTVLTVIAFYDEQKKKKCTLLIDVSFTVTVNNLSIMNVLDKSLESVNKNWKDVNSISISSDSAPYMKAMVRNVQIQKAVPSLIHTAGVSHLIHVAINSAIETANELSIASRKFVIKIGAIFKHSPKLFRTYIEVCQILDLEPVKPSKVIPIRWTVDKF